MSKTVPLDGNSAARSLYYYVTCGLLGRCRIQVVQASSTDGAGCTRCLQAIRCSVGQVSRHRRCRCRLQVVQGAPGVSRLSGVPLGRCHVTGGAGVVSRWCRVHQVSPGYQVFRWTRVTSQVVQVSSPGGAGCTRCLQAIRCSVRQYHIQVVQGVHQVFPSFQVFR